MISKEDLKLLETMLIANPGLSVIKFRDSHTEKERL